MLIPSVVPYRVSIRKYSGWKYCSSKGEKKTIFSGYGVPENFSIRKLDGNKYNS